MSERDDGIRVALGVAYAEHMSSAERRDRAVDGTPERALQQALTEQSWRIVEGISRLLPREDVAGSAFPTGTPTKDTTNG